MSLKKSILFILSLIIFTVSVSICAFGQTLPDAERTGRALALRDLLQSIEGVAEEPPRVYKTAEGYLRFIGAPPSTYFAVAPGPPGSPGHPPITSRWWGSSTTARAASVTSLIPAEKQGRDVHSNRAVFPSQRVETVAG